MFLLLFSLVGSLFGLGGLIPGFLFGLLLDQVLLTWIWERQLRAFLVNGVMLRGNPLLASRLLFMRWQLFYVFHLVGFPQTAELETWRKGLARSLGKWGLIPMIARTTGETIEKQVISGAIQYKEIWRGSDQLGSEEKRWLFEQVAAVATIRCGLDENACSQLYDLAGAMIMGPREFKNLIMDVRILPVEFLARVGLDENEVFVQGELAVLLKNVPSDMVAEIHGFIEARLALRDEFIDRYAETAVLNA